MRAQSLQGREPLYTRVLQRQKFIHLMAVNAECKLMGVR